MIKKISSFSHWNLNCFLYFIFSLEIHCLKALEKKLTLSFCISIFKFEQVYTCSTFHRGALMENQMPCKVILETFKIDELAFKTFHGFACLCFLISDRQTLISSPHISTSYFIFNILGFRRLILETKTDTHSVTPQDFSIDNIYSIIYSII